jgi:flagellar biosynthesis protein FlhF
MNATDTKTYRGRTLEEVLPKIKAELGPDAEIVRQRSGLTGGVGGFFQRECVEVEAKPPVAEERPRRRFDAYDEEPGESAIAGPEPTEPEDDFAPFLPETHEADGLSAPGIQEIFRQAAPFAEQLGAALEPIEPAQPVAPAQPAAPSRQMVERPANAEAIVSSLSDTGVDSALAQEIVDQTVAHDLPFVSPRSLKRLVRRALARRIPVAGTAPAGARSIAFVGPGGSGKTLCTARLAAAYATRSSMPVVCISLRPSDGGAELASMLEPFGVGVRVAASGDEARAHLAGALEHALVVVDTPAVAPRSPAEVNALAAELEALGVGEVHLTLPSTYSGPAARELADLLAPLHPGSVALTHMDATSHIGGLLDFTIRANRPISYLSEGTGVPGGLEPADADRLATLLLP